MYRYCHIVHFSQLAKLLARHFFGSLKPKSSEASYEAIYEKANIVMRLREDCFSVFTNIEHLPE